MSGVYHPSIKNGFYKISYGKDFIELLEKEINGNLPSAFPPRVRKANIIPMLTTPEYSFECGLEIEGKMYNASVSSVTSISDECERIGSCYKLRLGERKNRKEIEEILSRNNIQPSRGFFGRDMSFYEDIRDPDWVWSEFHKEADRRLLEEINTPKRYVKFTVIQEEDEDDNPVHKGQRIVPKRLTDTRMSFCGDSGHPYEFSSIKKKDLAAYPIVHLV